MISKLTQTDTTILLNEHVIDLPIVCLKCLQNDLKQFWLPIV